MNPDEQPQSEASWQKVHPRLSRAVLYGLLIVVAVTAVVLLQARRRQDQADRLQFLETRIGMFDLLIGSDVGRASILETIESEGMLSVDLPASFRQRAMRVQAQVLSADNRREEALEALEAARALSTDATTAQALRIERAELLALTERGQEALDLLREGSPWSDPLLELARASEEAFVLETVGRKDEGRVLLDRALSRAPVPLPSADGPYLGLSPLRASPLVLNMTRRLAGPDGGVAAKQWLRLAALLPHDARVLREVAEALERAGRDVDAARLRARAAELDPPRAEPFLEDPLKEGRGHGR